MKQSNHQTIIKNPRAYHDYHIFDTFEAGLCLTGPEVKSAKAGRLGLKGAFVKIKDNELFLINAQIMPYQYARQESYDPNRTRKLLLKKKEIISLKTKIKQKNLTLIPLSCYTKRGWLKLQVGLAKGKKEFEKRAKIREKDIKREQEKALRGDKF